MAKRTDGRYVGQRSRSWLKLKFERTQEVVVGGWRPGKGDRGQSVGSLLMGIPDGSRLRYVGRVGSGFNMMAGFSVSTTTNCRPFHSAS